MRDPDQDMPSSEPDPPDRDGEGAAAGPRDGDEFGEGRARAAGPAIPGFPSQRDASHARGRATSADTAPDGGTEPAADGPSPAPAPFPPPGMMNHPAFARPLVPLAARDEPALPAPRMWSDEDWAGAVLRARRAGRAYVYLNLVEQRLRALVKDVLQPVFGTGDPAADDGLWIAAAAGPAQTEWVERAESVREMSRRRGYIVDPGDDDLIAFLTLPQLRELLVRNWWCFAPHLPDRRALERNLEEVEIGRHIVARNRVLTPDVLAQVERACLRVLAALDGGRVTGDGDRLSLDAVEELFAGRYADVVGVFPDRPTLQRRLPFADLIGEARSIDATGVALNLLCQNYSARELGRLAQAGCEMRLLFLNPAGDAMRRRERDEGLKRGLLARMTTMNILHVRKVRARLSEPSAIAIRVYDEVPRFSAYFVDDSVALVQPYLRTARGVESPAFVLRPGPAKGLHGLYAEEFEQMWADARPTS